MDDQVAEHSQEENSPGDILAAAVETISSSQDISVVLPTIVMLAVKITRAEMGLLELVSPDSGKLTFACSHNLPLSYKPSETPSSENLSREVLDSNQPVNLLDYASHSRSEPGLVDAGVKFSLGVPVTAQTNHLGVLSLFKTASLGVFNPQDVSFAGAVGRLAGMAILNLQLGKQANQYGQEAETLRQAAATVISELDLDHVLDQILIQLKKVIDYDSAALFLLEEESLRIVSAVGFPDRQKLIDMSFPTENGLFKQSLATGRATILADAQKDARFEQWTRGPQIRGWIGVPMHLRGRAIGFLTIDSYQQNAYGEQEAVLAQAFANEATIAIENAGMFKELQTLAARDVLTGLWNRRHFIASAKTEFQKARRYRQPLSLILFDIDDFKSVNDVYGHVVGDQVLQGVAKICGNNLRQIDLLGRYGGEEYMALLPNTTTDVARKVAERLRNLISDTPIDTDRGPVYISASFGVAGLDETSPDLDTLLKNVDRAAYSAKFDGKNRVSISEEGSGL